MRNFIGSKYDSNLTIKDIAKIMRNFIRKQYPECTFSITTSSCIDRNAIIISLMKSPYKAFFNDSIYELQLNQYYLEEDDKITNEIKNIMIPIYRTLKDYHMDNSDIKNSHFDTNFYIRLNVGKWDKPYQIKK